ncbi:restriction endonuclease subunit S [Nesterenkonia sp. CF4.4]|uniref:restriction endonuclease subunit S n=1 Tax=Nesterenkonia sp. CF4.4 TaxID=3373079 RepID=UPI003EE589FA
MTTKMELVGAQSSRYDLLSLTKTGVVFRDISNGKGKIPASFDNYQAINSGDLIMCLFDVDETPRTVGRARQPGMITGAYDRFVVNRDVLAEYVNWFYLSVDNVKGLRPLYRGLRKTVPLDQFMASEFPLPPVEEQAAIVKYLAHASARIDKAITAKRRLITLLDEIDLAAINGLDGWIKEGGSSGKSIEWLGPIPKTWQVVPAKRLFREVDRRSSTGSEGLLSLRMHEGLVDASNFTETPIPADSLVGYKIVEPGDLVMNRMRAAIGLFGVATERGLVSPDYSTMEVSDKAFAEFYLRLFKSEKAKTEFRSRSTGLGTGASGFMRLYHENFGAIPLPVPPISEQHEIVDQIIRKQSETQPVKVRTQREIALIQEFRTRLVTEVVTGQVDVRAIAAMLPDLPVAVEDPTAISLDEEVVGSLTKGD